MSNHNTRPPARRQRSTGPAPSGPSLAHREAKDPMLTLPEVLAELKIGRSTFDDWRIKGLAPAHIKLPNGQFRIRRRALDAWLADRTSGTVK